MTNYLILATHYGPEFMWFIGIPIWGIALVVCLMGALEKAWRVLGFAGGGITFFIFFATTGPMGSYANDTEVAGDLIAVAVLMVLNVLCTRDKAKSPRITLREMGLFAWPLAALLVFVGQLLTGFVIFLLVRLIFR